MIARISVNHKTHVCVIDIRFKVVYQCSLNVWKPSYQKRDPATIKTDNPLPSRPTCCFPWHESAEYRIFNAHMYPPLPTKYLNM